MKKQNTSPDLAEFYIPSTWRRLTARGTDQLIQLLCYIPFLKTAVLLFFTEGEVSVSLWQVGLFLLIPVIYEFSFLYLMQATPGKWCFGLKVVPCSDPYKALDWRQALLRPLADRFVLFFSWAVYALAFFRYDRTHLADWVAETRVVQDHPRESRTHRRWVLGSLFFVFFFFDGLTNARILLNGVDLENNRLDLRAVFEAQSQALELEDFEEFED